MPKEFYVVALRVLFALEALLQFTAMCVMLYRDESCAWVAYFLFMTCLFAAWSYLYDGELADYGKE
jgi:hypothetical protein